MSVEDDVRPGLAGYWDRFVGPQPFSTATSGTVVAVLRPGQGVRQHVSFALLHVPHPFVVALDRADTSRGDNAGPLWAWAHSSWMLGAASVIAVSPRRTRLPISIGATIIGVALDRALGPSEAAPWFAPVYYTKALIGHAAGSVWNAHAPAAH